VCRYLPENSLPTVNLSPILSIIPTVILFLQGNSY
jgi:hypothetical protein